MCKRGTLKFYRSRNPKNMGLVLGYVFSEHQTLMVWSRSRNIVRFFLHRWYINLLALKLPAVEYYYKCNNVGVRILVIYSRKNSWTNLSKMWYKRKWWYIVFKKLYIPITIRFLVVFTKNFYNCNLSRVQLVI